MLLSPGFFVCSSLKNHCNSSRTLIFFLPSLHTGAPIRDNTVTGNALTHSLCARALLCDAFYVHLREPAASCVGCSYRKRMNLEKSPHELHPADRAPRAQNRGSLSLHSFAFATAKNKRSHASKTGVYNILTVRCCFG